MTEKRLYKSADKKISGVCGGIAEYFGIDPAIVRIIWACTFLFTGAGLIAYIVAAIVMNENPGYEEDHSEDRYTYSYDSETIKGFKPEV
ncbi:MULTISPECIES: PspC domain-containing protein [unclassified Butyrivibrio]|jgi:phage shock protein PspC (stress-responsive transcriptional regulator)|uniref:PspC domain-containing protein n=1 Tax=unclassified Butyrivibrio TaxID=2639466 RepID=UPI000427DD69|nr:MULTISPECIES: PspC domain-containing protein [unclassified Butyrivibrio]